MEPVTFIFVFVVALFVATVWAVTLPFKLVGLLGGGPSPRPDAVIRDAVPCARSGCGAVNAPHAHFCGRCGAPLMRLAGGPMVLARRSA